MSFKQKLFSLRYRSGLAAILAVGVGLAVFAVIGFLFSIGINRVLMTDLAIVRRNEEKMADFRAYVQKYAVSTSDRGKIMSWCRANHYVSLTIARNDEIIFDTENEDKDLFFDSDTFSFILSIGPNMDQNSLELRETTILEFANGAYLVSIADMSSDLYYRGGTVLAAALGALSAVLVIFFFSRSVTRSIVRLSDDINEVSNGNLQRPISVPGNDELSALADHVDHMRTSIMERMQQENAAWQANRDLITSLSHDLRTPLTTLIGYLNLIEQQEYSSAEELHQYATIALDKAMKLKTLSDELFRYFLVYGSPTENVKKEVYDAHILLEQLLGERTLLMTEDGYRFRIVNHSENCRIHVNVDSLARVFDNLFSNLTKYADPAESIVIFIGREERQLLIEMSNAYVPSRTESTRIGLETCKKLIYDLNGRFFTKSENGHFTVRILLPLFFEDMKENDQ